MCETPGFSETSCKPVLINFYQVYIQTVYFRHEAKTLRHLTSSYLHFRVTKLGFNVSIEGFLFL